MASSTRRIKSIPVHKTEMGNRTVISLTCTNGPLSFTSNSVRSVTHLHCIVLSYLNDGLTSIKFSWKKTLELMVEFHCQRDLANFITAGTQGFAKKSFNLIAILDKSKNIYSICKTKYYVTIINKIIQT